MKATELPVYSWFRKGIRDPRYRQWVIAGVLLYLVSPIDLIPSFIPGFGELDDIALVVLLVSELAQLWLGNWRNPDDPLVDTEPSPYTQAPNVAGAGSPVVDIPAVSVDRDD